MNLVIRKREEPLGWGVLVVYLGALALAFLVCALLLTLSGKPGLGGLAILFRGAFGQGYSLLDGLVKAIPIFLCALGVALSFRMQIWNIGAEGQFALGAVGATWAALTFPGLPGALLMPLMFLSAMAAGAAWGAIPAALRLRLGVSEVISSLMLNYVGILFLEYLVFGVWKDAASFGFPMTAEFASGGQIARIAPGVLGKLHWGLLACPIAGIAYSVFLSRTRLGFELAACGEGERVARYAQLPYSFLVFFVMGLGGALAGLAGSIETSATLGRLQPTVMVGYGYTAIVVAWLARLKPWAIAFTAYLLAAFRVGGEVMQLELQIPAAFGPIMEGAILLCVLAGQFFLTYSVSLKRPAKGPADCPGAGEDAAAPTGEGARP
ncbi:MAG TPA: ABC transporter permease [Humidesulfovibrio sp.]|uniref:ABC transporter permease n=1 Tax=Humidesulfovibrio sp. TaxID=2910988 RepID=UPI002C590EEA|nr:ABC transporter permease [Humidesulfovibrio sp.]HWR04340.1 ABC transporter permease [Humidesulfovibrio sp.]